MRASRFEAMKRGLMLVLALAAAAPAFAQRNPAPPVTAPPRAITPQQRAEFEGGLLSSNAGQLFRALKAAFPSDYQAMVDELLGKAVAARGDRAAMQQAGFDSIRSFYDRRLPQILNAPASYLNAQNARELDFMRSLSRQDPALCKMYATTGFAPGTVVPAESRQLMGRVGVALVEAAKAGVGRSVDPQRGQISQADAGAWTAKMRELNPSDAMTRFLAGDQSGAADPVEACRLGMTVYEAVAALPSEQSARITAYIISTTLTRGR